MITWRSYSRKVSEQRCRAGVVNSDAVSPNNDADAHEHHIPVLMTQILGHFRGLKMNVRPPYYFLLTHQRFLILGIYFK